jgi:hypothetical protein
MAAPGVLAYEGCMGRLAVSGLLVFALLLASPSWAVLGEPVGSVASDQARLRGRLRSIEGEGYAVHEIQGADGTLVREFAAPSGRVFGVAWQGPFVPDLAPLLGAWFEEYRQAPRPAVRRRGPLSVRTEHLVVETGGHLRSYQGRVYLPDAVPAAVSAAVVR